MKIEDQIKELRNSAERHLAMATLAEEKLIAIAKKCSESAKFDLLVGTGWIHVFNREDLSAVMTLAPRWSKANAGKSIQYSACVGDLYFYVFAFDGALPPTCKVVKTERVVPAQPEKTIVDEVVVCEMGELPLQL